EVAIVVVRTFANPAHTIGDRFLLLLVVVCLGGFIVRGFSFLLPLLLLFLSFLVFARLVPSSRRDLANASGLFGMMIVVVVLWFPPLPLVVVVALSWGRVVVVVEQVDMANDQVDAQPEQRLGARPLRGLAVARWKNDY